MSAWHRDNPELVGTEADPWMIHDDYRRYITAPRTDLRDFMAEIDAMSRAAHTPWPPKDEE